MAARAMTESTNPPYPAPRLAGRAFAALAQQGEGAEARWLAEQVLAVGAVPANVWAAWQAQCPPADRLLHGLVLALGLQPLEVVAIALAAAVETDAMAARALAWLQAPVGPARPSVGLVLAAAQRLGLTPRLADLVDGHARASGLLQLPGADEAHSPPLVEQPLRVPLPLVLALSEGSAAWPGVRLGPAQASLEGVPPSLRAAALAQAEGLWPQGQHGSGQVLAIRSSHPREAQTAAAWLAQAMQQRPAYLHSLPEPGLGVWLGLMGALPVVCAELAPGEVRQLPELPGYRGPVLAAGGLEGSWRWQGEPVPTWTLPLPDAAERTMLWRQHLPPALAETMGVQWRLGPARIHQMGLAAQAQARVQADASNGTVPRPEVQAEHVARATRAPLGADMGTLAEHLPEDVATDALVLSPELRATLDALCQRCRLREGLTDALGPAARSRYRPGVRALFVGPSGTGKTSAAAWLATRLARALYRVDLSALTSKYIGETEKNLSLLFARAEHAEVVLLFDEADALFGRRTEVKDSNDRHANQETNYLLQRIESYEGIVLLTSNSRSRFDPAFTRRLDDIIDFPAPGPQERRALWQAHLGTRHQVSALALNGVAAACDFAGGHIRNACLAAASRALAQARPLAAHDLYAALEDEYRKLAKPLPMALAQALRQ
jgi:ATPase family associated with various cellular activities (AAA)